MSSTTDRFFGRLVKFVDKEFKSQWNTDLTITCQGEKFFAHKIILATQSEFFRKACDPESLFVEAKSGKINLQDDDPFLVKLMLVYCYTGKLDCNMRTEWSETHYNYGHYQNSAAGSAISSILIYCLADKYQIEGLKVRAASFVKHWLRHTLEHGCMGDWPVVIPKIARKIYISTPSTDRGLRDLILYFVSAVINDPLGFEKYKRFKMNMDKVEGFWADLIDYTVQVGKRDRECPEEECLQTSAPLFPEWTVRRGGVTARCRFCNNSFTVNEWNRFEDADEAFEGDDDSDDEVTQASASSNKRKRSDDDDDDDGPTPSRPRSIVGNDNVPGTDIPLPQGNTAYMEHDPSSSLDN